MTRPTVGTRVRLTKYVERFPHFIVEAGAKGTVTVSDEESFCVKMDEPIEGCGEWDNEIVWMPDFPSEDEWAAPPLLTERDDDGPLMCPWRVGENVVCTTPGPCLHDRTCRRV